MYKYTHIKLPIDLVLEYTLKMNCINFIFNEEYFKQTFGIAMGNPPSPVLSNLYMEFFECLYVPKIFHFPVTWYCYIDDISAIIPKDLDVNTILAQTRGNLLIVNVVFIYMKRKII